MSTVADRMLVVLLPLESVVVIVIEVPKYVTETTCNPFVAVMVLPADAAGRTASAIVRAVDSVDDVFYGTVDELREAPQPANPAVPRRPATP